MPSSALPRSARTSPPKGCGGRGTSIGDRFDRTAGKFRATTSCACRASKLGVRFDDPGMVKRFHQSGRNGFYLAVTREGEIGAGDTVELLARDPGGLTVADVIGLYVDDADKQLLLERQPPSGAAGRLARLFPKA